ncbi:MAG TPA: hypothetical protein VNO23_17475 [Candidatus Binatia bacterium]|nr:hypothetical protein [Candidatus Binatia bacterium]
MASESRRVPATPTEIGDAVAEGVLRGTRVLRQRLDEEGVARALPKRLDTEEYRLECLLLGWFLAEVAVAARFGRRARAVRRALRRHLLGAMDRGDLTPAVLVNFESVQRERFAEYADALRSGPSFQRLGTLAWLRIQGGDRSSDRMTMLLAVWAAAELRTLQGLVDRYALPARWAAWWRRPARKPPRPRAWFLVGSPGVAADRVPNRRLALPALGQAGRRVGLVIAAAVGSGLFLVGAGIFAHQIGTWLDTRTWEPCSLLDLLAAPALRPAWRPVLPGWLAAAESWPGVSAVLAAALAHTPAPLVLMVTGGLIAVWALRD